jgi:hypothetical protein
MEKLTLENIVGFLQVIDKKSKIETRKSLNHLPEYYLGVKLSDCLYKSGHGFELEKPTKEIIELLRTDNLKIKQTVSELSKKLKIDEDKIIKRVTNGRVDLVALTQEKNSIRNLIELKKGAKISKLENDITRLIFFSKISDKRSIQRSFLVFVSTLDERLIEDKIQILANSFNIDINYINFKAKLESTKKTSIGRDVFVWAIEVINS